MYINITAKFSKAHCLHLTKVDIYFKVKETYELHCTSLHIVSPIPIKQGIFSIILHTLSPIDTQRRYGRKTGNIWCIKNTFQKKTVPQKRTIPPAKLLHLEFLWCMLLQRRYKAISLIFGTTVCFLQYQISPSYYDIFIPL